jgi:[protein-PII] uridylyltransferase
LSPAALKIISNIKPLRGQIWPREVLESFLRILRSGDEAITALEILEQENILSHYIPEWDVVRNLRQHNAYHRYTVDRHLLETAVLAGELRPESYGSQEAAILIVAALLHDIGKGLPGDHSTNGARLARKIAIRMGLVEPSVSTIGVLVRHHLLLPDLATRRDIHDPATSEKVLAAFPDTATLELAGILAKADGEATGPLGWGPWKEGLVRDLIRIVRRHLEGGRDERAGSESNLMVATGSGDNGGEGDNGGGDYDSGVFLMRPGALAGDIVGDATGVVSRAGEAELNGRHVSVTFFEEPTGDQIVVKTHDLRGLLASIAGVFALRGINIRSADVSTIGDTAIDSFVVEMRIGDWPDWEDVASDIAKALNGELDLDGSIREREHLYREHPHSYREEQSYKELASGPLYGGDVKVVLDSGASAAFSVLEVHSDDSLGLLYRLTKVLLDNKLDVVRARVSTIGSRIIDSFYISNDQIERATTEDEVLAPDIENALLRAAMPL